MATFIRGVPGILEEIDKRRDQAARRLASIDARSRGAKTRAIRLDAEHGALTELLGYLRMATILSEADFDRNFEGMTVRSKFIEVTRP